MNSLHLSVCQLEDRSTPATFGVPWGNTGRVTVSFVPDGTAVNGAGSTLFQMFQQAGIPAATGQGEILKALQTWAARTPANLVLVADQGQALGVSGATQGDTRFGDIRIAARPMAANVFGRHRTPRVGRGHPPRGWKESECKHRVA